jgi:hypothetical protein
MVIKKGNMELVADNHNTIEENIHIYFSTFIKIMCFKDSLSGKIKVI